MELFTNFSEAIRIVKAEKSYHILIIIAGMNSFLFKLEGFILFYFLLSK